MLLLVRLCVVVVFVVAFCLQCWWGVCLRERCLACLLYSGVFIAGIACLVSSCLLLFISLYSFFSSSCYPCPVSALSIEAKKTVDLTLSALISLILRHLSVEDWTKSDNKYDVI